MTMKNNPAIKNEKPVRVNENHLYSLLYAGRITLKEYLERVKNNRLQKQAA